MDFGKWIMKWSFQWLARKRLKNEDLVPENIPAKGRSWFGAVHDAHPNSEVSGGIQLPDWGESPDSRLGGKVQIVQIGVEDFRSARFDQPVDQLVQLKIIVVFSKWIVQGVSNPWDQNGKYFFVIDKNGFQHNLQIFVFGILYNIYKS